ncbi:GlsB/YeaQ/YmgE family stress response membrane protein [Lysobacter sp. F6437]|uniref:GlsB/YeaQ/YmgE family stress response membrane protein n=1 Tax=Lysobacter sp. F6437 TaxID=3459296 RepID=UPI00403DDCD9
MFDGILGYIIGGAVIGVLARFFKPGADPMGWIMTILLGILGAVAGGYIAGMLGVSNRFVVWVIAIIAAIILLVIYQMVSGKKVDRPG